MDSLPQPYDGTCIHRVLDFFSKVSGHKMNFTKSNMFRLVAKHFQRMYFLIHDEDLGGTI